MAADLVAFAIDHWLAHLLETLTGVRVGYLIAAVVVRTAQTTLTALAWLAIPRGAYEASASRSRPC
ncbi:MAG: hypothetical protein M3304_10990 [Actinomycetota bacterium]|nr:hypothetical protein [Actinomycetota bacterium]